MILNTKTPATLSRATIVLLCGLAGGALLAAESDWPQWRGPQRDGRSPDRGLLQSWPEGGPPLAWRASGLGAGFSSVSVAGSRIYTMGDHGDAQYLLGLDRTDGHVLWKTKVGPAWKDKYLGPRSTPTVDGDRVYVVTTEGDVVCVENGSGKVLWQRNLPADFGGVMMAYQGTYHWKFSESPLVDGKKLIVTPGGKDAALVALNKMTGEEIWRAAIPDLGSKGGDGAGYSSVVVSEAGDVRQYVQFVGRGVIGVEAATGRFLWGYNGVANGTANIATPLVRGDLIFASSGYDTGSALLKIERDGEAFSAKEVYFLEPNVMQNHHGGLIHHEGYVYTGTGHNKGLPLSVKLATGEVAWGPVRNAGKSSAAIAFADGRLYFRYQDGLMVLVEATPDGYKEHGSFRIPEVAQPSWPHPVIAGGRLYLREQDNLFCYDLTARTDSAAEAAFERLKGLAGTWTGEATGTTHVFRVSANGSVVMETMFPDTDHEMINMYHLDGDALRLTHYCAAGNQPQMKLAAASTTDALTFEFVGGTNLDPATDGFIHDARLVFHDEDTLESRWGSWKDGKEDHEMVFKLRRAGN